MCKFIFYLSFQLNTKHKINEPRRRVRDSVAFAQRLRQEKQRARIPYGTEGIGKR
jgi:hypothetical protein